MKAIIPIQKVITIQLEVELTTTENYGTAQDIVRKSIQENTLDKDFNNPFEGQESFIQLNSSLLGYYYKEFEKGKV